MWTLGWRDQVWSELDQSWDLIVIGGGITGAGILREATRSGLRVILFEAHDFVSGTSSRSSKLVHGGLRYLRNAQIRLTYESVHERERLLREGRGLVTPLPFLMANFVGDHIPAWVFGAGLSLYDLLALKWNHRRYTPDGLRELCPQLTMSKLIGGYRYFDAVTDDARLVLRILLEAVAAGGRALNYAKVEGLLKQADGYVSGVFIKDLSPEANGRTAEVRAKIVINATGAWADELRSQVGVRARLRKLRGSHLIFPFEKLPLNRAVTFLHPKDGRPVFIFPWETVTVIGTTDVDDQTALHTDIRISLTEADYLMEAILFIFPSTRLTLGDVQATYSGVRAVLDTGKANPSKESRESLLWNENGLLTITGGKLTTFRLMAQRTLNAILPEHKALNLRYRVLDSLPPESIFFGELEPSLRLRLLGRYGNNASTLIDISRSNELDMIGAGPSVWAELRWASQSEGVVHLDDLLLRRVRLGLLLPRSGLDQLERIRDIVQPELSWDDVRWAQEVSDYSRLWVEYYSLPN